MNTQAMQTGTPSQADADGETFSNPASSAKVMQPGNSAQTDVKATEAINPVSPASPDPIQPKPTTRVSVEVPANPQFNPFDPTWVKLWENVGPISYLVLLCILVWLLTRLVEVVKGK